MPSIVILLFLGIVARVGGNAPTSGTPVISCTSENIDIGFILDSSGSVGSFYQTEKNFIKSMAGAFGVSENGAHAGVVTFSSNAIVSIKLNQYKNLSSFNNAVDAIHFMNAGTRIDLGLQVADNELFKSSNGGRFSVERLMVLLTDGIQGGGQDPVLIGQAIRRRGINIVAIGIGSNVRHNQLTEISGVGNYYMASSFNALTTKTFIDDMTKASCSVMYQPSTDGRFYKLHNDVMNWPKSMAQCEQEGALLAIVDNDATFEHMKSTYGSISTWVGAKYDVKLGQWVWVDGQPIENIRWAGVKPSGNNFCLTTNYNTPGVWNDTSCNQQLPFICQKGTAKPLSPVLSWNTLGNRIRFTCQIFRRNYSIPTVYEVGWFQSGPNGQAKEMYTETLDHTDESYLQNDDSNTLYHLGVDIYCKVRTWYITQPNVKSTYATSNIFFAGLKFEPSNFLLLEGRSPAELTVSLTVPLLCQNGTTSCKVSVELVSANADVLFNPCHIVFHSTTNFSTTIKTVYVSTKSDLVDDGQKSIKVTPRIRSSNTSDDWKNVTDPTIDITRISVSTGRCTSTGDPHIRSFDGAYFHHYRVGHYTLVESKARLFQIHVGTHRCGRVSCNCGVAVREGDDVLSVDMCIHKVSPQATYRSNQEPQTGTYIEQSSNGRIFILKFKSGAFVKFAARSYYADITVQLPPDDFNNTVGICGLIDKDSSNDMSDINGKLYGNCGHQACPGFTESWKLSREQSLFYYKGGDIKCLPDSAVKEESGEDEDKCSIQSSKVDTQVTSGYRKMVFPGQLDCDRKRNDTTNINVIVTKPPDEDDDDVPAEEEPVVSDPVVVPTFPTETGITEPEAQNYCEHHIVVSNIYEACKTAIGAEFVVTGYIEQCVADIQILDNKVVALQSAMEAMKSDCEEVVMREPATWDTGDDGILKPPTKVTDKLCPNECSWNGNCTKGICICNEGFVTEDCSVRADQVPRLEEFPCGRLCDIRKRNCRKITVTSFDLVAGNVVCGFNESERLDGGSFIKIPSSGFFSFSEAICELPTRNQVVTDNYLSSNIGIPSQTYKISLSNDGSDFSHNTLPLIVYDSKCIKCENSSKTCTEPKTCVLKENTCMIRGFCFLNGEADPNDKKCKVCDPTRSTSKFVHRRGIPNDCKDRGFNIVCHEKYVTGIWEKDLFGAYKISMWLNDPSCNVFRSNSTHVWITANFLNCGSITNENSKLMLQENTAALRITYAEQAIIQRTVIYNYRMQCAFDRTVNVSTPHYFNTTHKDGNNISSEGTAKFNATIDIYTSTTFLLPIDGPITVTSFQPIFIGIKEMNNNAKFKFIVNQCFATPTSSINGINYMFFDMKCPIDPSFKIVSFSTNHFNFQIDAFTFIQVRKSVYIHCQIYICAVNATSSPCTQKCHLRKRRSVIEELPLKEVSIQTSAITFQKKITCNDISCPAISHCLELYPAECRCNKGYVFNGEKSLCSKEKVFSVRGLHLDENFITSYSNTSSIDFLRFASETEKKLTVLFQSENSKIVGVKIIGARNGSVVLDLLLIYANTSSVGEAFESFISTVMVNETKSIKKIPTERKLKIKTNIMPTIIIEKEIIKENNTMFLIATIVPSVFVLFALIAIWIVICKLYRKRGDIKKQTAEGIDNKGVENDVVILEKMS